MKRIYLQKIIQHGEVCYIGKIDPRELVRVATKVEMSETQDAQRPLNKKRVYDIAKYVADSDGILPNTLTIATKDNKFDIKESDTSGLFYMSFPSEADEYADFANKIDVMDGQHRLYSFLDDICQLQNDEVYEIGFTLYDRPHLNQRRKIFISCNEKQEKVSGNLLMWFKEKLGMLTDEEKNFYNVVQQLSTSYPLQGHIIMSAEQITNGVKAKEVMAALKQANIQTLQIGNTPMSDNDKVTVINRYLSAWEQFGNFSFTRSKLKDVGPAIKMAGLKYMILLLPTVWNKAVQLQQPFTEEFVKNMLKQLATALGVEREHFFTCEQHKLKFRDRTVTDEFAADSIGKLSNYQSGAFNPLG